MKTKAMISILTICILLSGNILGQSFIPANVRVEVTPEFAPGILNANIPLTFDIYLEYTGPQTATSIATSLRFVGSDGLENATLVSPDSGTVYLTNTALMNGFGGDAGFWEFLNEVTGRSWEGVLPDSFFHAGAALANGWPPGLGEQLHYSFNYLFQEEGTFCLEWFDPCCLDGWVIDYENMLYVETQCWEIADTTICGDVNDDGHVNILDVLYIIRCIYFPIFPCDMTGWDFDGSGNIDILDIVYIIMYLYKNGPPPQCPQPSGNLTGYGGCGMPYPDPESDTLPGDQSCLFYEYDGYGNLSLIHANAGFNCCAEEIQADFEFSGNVITIVESETSDPCDCACLYTLDFEIINLPPGEYTIIFVEPYRHPDDPVLECTIDLSGPTSSFFCVPRIYYPWGQI